MTCTCVVPAGATLQRRKPGMEKKTVVFHGEEDWGQEKKYEQEIDLVEYEKLPEYMKENEFIRRYYRSELPVKHAFLSLFRWHNETLNVWTHLIGFLVFLGLTVMHLRDVPVIADLLNNFNFNWPMAAAAAENVSKDPSHFYKGSALIKLPGLESLDNGGAAVMEAPRWPFMVFMAGSMFCLLCSSVCHLFCCHSQQLSLFLWRMDYVGIAVMIVTSFFPPIYYIFLCQPIWQLLYLSAISAFGVATAATLLAPRFSTGQFRAYRAFLFLAMGLSGLVPATHAVIVNWDEPQRPITLAYESAMAVFYVVGTAFYVGRVPERWRPGAFDLTGHSHQIFHVFVLAGALAHYAAALVLMEWRDRVSSCSTTIV